MVNMLQISTSKNPQWGKLDDIAYNFMLSLPHQKLYMRNLKRKNSHKEKSTMYHMSQYHLPKNPLGKNGWYDIVLCWYCLIKNFIWENRRENSYKEKSAIWCFQQVINQRVKRLSPWNLQTFHTNVFNTYKMWNMVDYVKISTRLSHYLVCKCSYVHMTYGTENLNAKYYIKYNLSPSKQHKLHYLCR